MDFTPAVGFTDAMWSASKKGFFSTQLKVVGYSSGEWVIKAVPKSSKSCFFRVATIQPDYSGIGSRGDIEPSWS